MKDQLNVRLEPSLVERVKKKAKEEGRTVGALVGTALEAWLASASNQGRDEEMALDYFKTQQANADLATQVHALSKRLEALEAQPLPQASRTNQPAPTLPASAIAPGQLPARRLTQEEAAGIITLPDMADRLGLSGGGSAITNFIGREAKKIGGAMPVGVVYRGFCLLGKGLLPGGQKECWLWKEV
jgi:hypothetical protein